MTLQARYSILRKITDGGTAEIFLATQHGAHGFEKTVVLKRIFPAFYADPQFRNMLVDEAHIAMSLNHSNIVQVLDLGHVRGRLVARGVARPAVEEEPVELRAHGPSVLVVGKARVGKGPHVAKGRHRRRPAPQRVHEGLRPGGAGYRPAPTSKTGATEADFIAMLPTLDMAELQVDRGTGQGFVMLAFDTTPGYLDTLPFPATLTKWKYRAIYHAGDAQVGLWSAEVPIAVGG